MERETEVEEERGGGGVDPRPVAFFKSFKST
jgi:hypothetical protein